MLLQSSLVKLLTGIDIRPDPQVRVYALCCKHGQRPMAREITNPRCGELTLVLLNGHMSNYILSVYIYMHIFVLLSTLVGNISFFSG